MRQELGTWKAAEPSSAATWLARAKVPWWIAGGWALDLFLKQVTRVHADLDVGVLRRDTRDVLEALPEWEHFEARDGTLTRLRSGVVPSVEVHSLWCRPAGSKSWALEIMLDESDREFWLFRREPSIRRPLSTLIQTDTSGIRYLAPEIQLLYKAKALRSHDQADFERVVTKLNTEARTWLRDSLVKTSPGHSWLTVLAESAASGA